MPDPQQPNRQEQPNPQEQPEDPSEAGSISDSAIRRLNRTGDLAHVAVSLLLLALTVLVLAYACLSYAHQMPLLAHAFQPPPPPTEGDHHPADPFIQSSIEFFSNILFAVILLEVLHTTLTFLKDRSSRPLVRAFLVVAILSIVRKLLLVGAESSMTGEKGIPFLYSAAGTFVSIISILLLVMGLTYINRTPEKSE